MYSRTFVIIAKLEKRYFGRERIVKIKNISVDDEHYYARFYKNNKVYIHMETGLIFIDKHDNIEDYLFVLKAIKMIVGD